MAREMPGYFFFFGGIEATKSILTGGDKTKDGKSVVFISNKRS